MHLIPNIPVPLDEAAAWLERNGVTGLTSRNILRYGAYGYIKICLSPLCDGKIIGYLPLEDNRKHDPNITVYLGDIYELPRSILRELETNGKATTSCVHGADGELFSFALVDVTIDKLRINPHELKRFRDAYELAAKGETVLVTSQSGDDWKDKARIIADECFDSDTKSRCRDSLKGYSNRVMELMQERDIKGPRGIIDNPNHVMREALQSKKWWANKSK